MNAVAIPKRYMLAQEFRDAGPRGLTRREIERVVGVQHWRRRLAELKAEGYEFTEHTGRYDRHRIWRWVMTHDPERLRAFREAPSAEDLARARDAEGQASLFDAADIAA